MNMKRLLSMIVASDGRGATAVQILLRDGHIVTLGHFTGWNFYADPYSIFNYITADENGELVIDTAALEAGEYIFAVAGQPGEYTEEICSTPGGVRITVAEPAHVHSYEAAVTAPTCTEGDYTTYTCSCGDSYIADKTEALSHDFAEGTCIRCGEADPDYVTVIANGWFGYTTWVLTSDGTLTFSPTEQKENGQTNLKNYWKVNGVLILPWGDYAGIITKVFVEEGIHDIGQMAFYELPNLTEVELPASIVEIRNYAFKGMTLYFRFIIDYTQAADVNLSFTWLEGGALRCGESGGSVTAHPAAGDRTPGNRDGTHQKESEERT